MAAHIFALVDRHNFYVSRERADRRMIALDLINARAGRRPANGVRRAARLAGVNY
ncbi:MAG TPA: hypothetical protein VIQ24_08750 [Pyrinomonadaceae bacterium]